MVQIQLLSDSGRTAHEAQEAAELVMSLAGPGEGLEHVYAQPSPAGMDLVLFLVATAIEHAEETARTLCDRALFAGLSGDKLARCQVNLLIPVAELMLLQEPPDR